MGHSERPLSVEQSLRTVDIERRDYGRRYTWLPVDSLDSHGFEIDFSGAYMRPELLDIRSGDIVRWREGGRLVQARITAIQRDGAILRVQLEDATLLPPETFLP